MRDDKEGRTMTGHLSWLRGRQHRVNAAALCSLLLAVASASAQNSLPAIGNVGIGTMTPSAPLSIQGTGYASTLMTLQSAEPARYGATLRTSFSDGWFRLI